MPKERSPGFITLDLSPEDMRLGFITQDLSPCNLQYFLFWNLTPTISWIYHQGFITRGHASWIYHPGFITAFPVPCPQDLPISKELPKITGILAFFWLFLSFLGIFGHFCCHNSSLSTRDSHPHQSKSTTLTNQRAVPICVACPERLSEILYRKISIDFHPFVS